MTYNFKTDHPQVYFTKDLFGWSNV